MHVIDKINMTFHVHLSILPQAPNLTKIKVFGDLPLLQVNFSDRKYKTLMRIVDLVVPKDPEAAAPPPSTAKPKSAIGPLLSKNNYKDDLVLGDTTESEDDQGSNAVLRKETEERDKVRLPEKRGGLSYYMNLRLTTYSYVAFQYRN